MKNCFKVITSFLILSQLVCILSIPAFSVEKSDALPVDNYAINIGPTPTIGSPINNINIPTRVSFDNTDVVSYRIETEGLSATEVSSGSMEYDIMATDEFGVLDMYATYADGAEVLSSIYTYKEDDKIYLSDISQDQAWYDSMKLKYDNGDISLDDFKIIYNEFTRNCLEIIERDSDEISGAIPVENKTIVTGQIKWELPTGTIAPLLNAKVELIKACDGEDVTLSTNQYTDFNGNYTFEIDNEYWNDLGENIFVRFWLEAKTYKVTNNWVFGEYSYDMPAINNVFEGLIEYPTYCIKSDTNNIQYKATYVHQSMTISERFAFEMGMPEIDYNNSSKTKLNVAYPSAFVPSQSAYCFGNDKQSVAAIGRNNYESIDTITHEYGHYVQYIMDCYGASLEEIICNIPIHVCFSDHFFDKLSKEYAMELTWSEAWASVFSTLAERYYWHKSVPEYNYFDVIEMSEKSCLGYRLENPNWHAQYTSYDNVLLDSIPVQDNRGEAQEMAVKAFLWDLYDTSTSESFDDVALGYQNWWNCTTQAGIYTLEDFISYMDSVHPELRSEIGAIMAYHKISPDAPVPSAYSACEPPELTFVINGGEAHPNNRFVVYFYDANGNCLGETDMFNQHGQYIDEDNIDDSFVGHRESVTVQIDNDVWQSVLQEIEADCATGATVYVSIGGYRYDDTSPSISDDIREYSGPYFSPYITLETFNLSHNYYLEDIGDGYHAQECFNCGHVDEDTVEEHSFDSWVFISDTRHIEQCGCGVRGSTTAGHVFRMPDSPSDPRICMGCGYTKFLGGNGGNIIISISKVTVNGSYQMPDGTVYLVDSDIEAYLNGTLVFYDKDDLPVVQ